jgi:hypothetical protein
MFDTGHNEPVSQKIDKGLSFGESPEDSSAEPGSIRRNPFEAPAFQMLNSGEVSSRRMQQERAAEFAGGDSIRRNHKRPADSRYLCTVSNIIK